MEKEKAIVILSGGLDSSTCAYIAKDEGYELYCLSFNYGQKHSHELEHAKQIAKRVGAIEHRIMDLPHPTKTALVEGNKEEIPEVRSIEEMSKEIPPTYVPARNTVFIALALQYAEEIDADAIFIGVNAMDYSGYVDCRPEYIEAWQQLINLATKKTADDGGTIVLRAPLIDLYKSEIIEWGLSLGVPYELTTSCYKGGDVACGVCDSCRLRIKGFKEAGAVDPIKYAISINWEE